jgi:predicted nicotinamide N-methyase
MATTEFDYDAHIANLMAAAGNDEEEVEEDEEIVHRLVSQFLDVSPEARRDLIRAKLAAKTTQEEHENFDYDAHIAKMLVAACDDKDDEEGIEEEEEDIDGSKLRRKWLQQQQWQVWQRQLSLDQSEQVVEGSGGKGKGNEDEDSGGDGSSGDNFDYDAHVAKLMAAAGSDGDDEEGGGDEECTDHEDSDEDDGSGGGDFDYDAHVAKLMAAAGGDSDDEEGGDDEECTDYEDSDEDDGSGGGDFDYDAHIAKLMAAAGGDGDDEEGGDDEECTDHEDSSDEDDGGGAGKGKGALTSSIFALDTDSTNSSMGADEIVYQLEGDCRTEVHIMQDLNAVAAACTSNVPAWSWRTWPGAKLMSKWIEKHWAHRLAAGAVVIEIGAGTGLVSCVAAKLGAQIVAVTDLPQAMSLLKHNLCTNFGPPVQAAVEEAAEEATESTHSASTHSAPPHAVQCPAGHPLIEGVAEDEDMVCNVCGEEDYAHDTVATGPGQAVFSCRACDFDICTKCFEIGGVGSQAKAWKALPLWFRCQCEEQAASAAGGALQGSGYSYTWRHAAGTAHAASTAPSTGLANESARQSVVLQAYDWDDPSSAPSLSARIHAELSKLREGGTDGQSGEGRKSSSLDDGGDRPLDLIILASDVTYDESVVAPLVRSIAVLREVLVEDTQPVIVEDTRPLQNATKVTLLLMHERRGEGIERRLLAEMKAAGWAAEQQDTKGMGLPRCEDALLLEVQL